MGSLVSLLTGGCGSNDSKDIFLDFESAEPSDEEIKCWNCVKNVLDNSSKILKDLKIYQGASDEIREAIRHPRDDDLQEVAWKNVLPLVDRLKKYYEFSIELECVMPKILEALCVGESDVEKQLSVKQALSKQFAEILHFTLQFDDLKMTNPNIQNDFSYYRRTLSRKRMASEDGMNEQANITTEMANRMSLFFAYPTPLLKTISDATTKYVSGNSNLLLENTTNMLSTLSNLCRVMIENTSLADKFQNEETKLFVLSVMVGVIILYDHVHPIGAFAKNADIDMKSTIKVLKDQPQGSVDGLFNALRYTTKHLNDESTPKHIRMLLA